MKRRKVHHAPVKPLFSTCGRAGLTTKNVLGVTCLHCLKHHQLSLPLWRKLLKEQQ
ncbi:MAG: hypothetical protein Q7R39_10325 [Dehalococcoidia bacterium]|nr:hypothetical protein [Dehalococcoidia bacterium]